MLWSVKTSGQLYSPICWPFGQFSQVCFFTFRLVYIFCWFSELRIFRFGQFVLSVQFLFFRPSILLISASWLVQWIEFYFHSICYFSTSSFLLFKSSTFSSASLYSWPSLEFFKLNVITISTTSSFLYRFFRFRLIRSVLVWKSVFSLKKRF